MSITGGLALPGPVDGNRPTAKISKRGEEWRKGMMVKSPSIPYFGVPAEEVALASGEVVRYRRIFSGFGEIFHTVI